MGELEEKKQLRESRNFNKEMLKQLLITSDNKIRMLKEENEKLRKSQIVFRDQIAARVYPKYIDIHSNYEQAAADAYAAADALLKFRDLSFEFDK